MRSWIVSQLQGGGWGWVSLLVPTPQAVYALVLLVLLGVMLARAPRAGVSRQQTLEAALSGGLGALIGTRLFYLLATGAVLQQRPIEWLDWSRGTASWGAYLGGILGIAIWARLSGTPALRALDLTASAAPLADPVGRWACFLAGDDFGRVSSVPWAIRFPAGSLPWKSHLSHGLIQSGDGWSLPVHPMQFYLMLNGLVVFLVLRMIWLRQWNRPSRTLAGFLTVYGVTRFWWEFFRDPDGGGASSGLSTSQLMCIALVAVGGALLATQRRPASIRAARVPA